LQCFGHNPSPPGTPPPNTQRQYDITKGIDKRHCADGPQLCDERAPD
jgi:hypothetical protein